MYLLSFSWEAQRALWEIFETGTVQFLPLEEEDITPIKNLMEKYRDLPMDLADAALVRVAEREGLRQVLTLDQRGLQRLSPATEGPLHPSALIRSELAQSYSVASFRGRPHLERRTATLTFVQHCLILRPC